MKRCDHRIIQVNLNMLGIFANCAGCSISAHILKGDIIDASAGEVLMRRIEHLLDRIYDLEDRWESDNGREHFHLYRWNGRRLF